VSDQTLGNILRRQGIGPVLQRRTTTTWKDFIHRHMDVLGSTDFFTLEVLTWRGLVTYYVLFFIHLDSRRVSIAGITDHPEACWMRQIACNATFEVMGHLNGCRYLLHDRDAKFCAEFRESLPAGGVKCLQLPPHSPNLNAFADRWVRSVKEECLSPSDLVRGSLVEESAHPVSRTFEERNHQGKNNVLLFPAPAPLQPGRQRGIRCRERLGGLLRYYSRAA
jgi:putative transposase